MAETAYQFAVRVLKGDPDVRSIHSCSACHGLGTVLSPSGFETVRRSNRYGEYVYPVWVDGHPERCEACSGSGVERVERYSDERDEPELCYGATRLPVSRYGRRY